MSDCCASKEPSKVIAYIPVIAIASVCLLGAGSLVYAGLDFMPAFMGLWFLIFGLVKLFDLKGFVESFKQYDLVTQKIPAYGYAYPFIEVALGLRFLANYIPNYLLGLIIIFALLTLLGVALKLRTGVAVDCACVGTSVKVPLGAVAIIENILMIVMSGLMLAI